MTIEFLPLLTLEVSHAYYGGRCPDFSYWLPFPARRVLAGGRVIAKPREDRLNLLFERRDGGAAFEPMLPLTGRTIQVGLKLLDRTFTNVTDLPFLVGDGLPLYRNAGNPRSLQAPVTLLLNSADPDDAELSREGLFCLVEITIDAGFYAAPPAFAVDFKARRETLKYYVVANNYNANEFNQLNVSDAGFGTDARPQIVFDRVAAAGFTATEIPAAQLATGNAKVTLFRSQQPVARQFKARNRIQLARNNDVLIPQLPQPGAAAPSADLIINVSK